MNSLIDANSKFSMIPSTDMTRSRFDMSHNVKTTFNTSFLVPLDILEVLPGDSFDMKTNMLARLQTLITPIMDNLYMDSYSFFVPARLLWKNFPYFMGESKSAWLPSTTYSIPQLKIPSGSTVPVGSTLDYLGFPLIGKELEHDVEINALPFRAIGKVYNDWFRDQNLQDEIYFPDGDESVVFDSTKGVLGGQCYRVNKYHDEFTSSLPAPQKGSSVRVPLGSAAPVIAGDNHNFGSVPLTFESNVGFSDAAHSYNVQVMPDSSDVSQKHGYAMANYAGGNYTGNMLYPSNLWTDLGEATASTINELRLAFQTQRLYEKLSYAGSRYIEIIHSFFGVVSPDARLQRSELLAYNHFDFNINQVVQSSQTDSTPQGYTAAYSLTHNSDNSYNKSFVEHGYILTFVCARYKHSYQQGLNKLFSRKDRFDFYWPTFAHIGEQPILNKQIYMDGSSTDDEVFGYQEAWYEYRYQTNRISGELRSGVPNSLDVWHLGDYYDSCPALSEGWMLEDKTPVDRVLAVNSSVSNQILLDAYFNCVATRPMPLFSVPGLIDHF